MAHNIDMTNDRANIAFLGSRKDVWHRMGQEMAPGMSIEEWAKAAGLNWSAIKVPAIASLEGAQFDHIDSANRFRVVDARNFVVRSDNGHPLGYCSDRYQPVQPADILRWFDRYISVDDNFALDVAGSLKQGEIVWATAIYRNPIAVAGEKHIFRLLMTTTYDGTGSTINKGTDTRVVCNNTLDVALADGNSVIRTRHSTVFDAARVGRELAAISQGFVKFKAMGDAMARVHMADEEVSKLFKHVLDIPFDAKQDDLSGRKLNQFDGLRQAYRATVAEGTDKNTCWTALNAITRYVDHDKATRGNGVSVEEKKFTSAQFGSGADMKAKAVAFIMPKIRDKVPA